MIDEWDQTWSSYGFVCTDFDRSCEVFVKWRASGRVDNHNLSSHGPTDYNLSKHSSLGHSLSSYGPSNRGQADHDSYGYGLIVVDLGNSCPCVNSRKRFKLSNGRKTSR